MTKIPFLLLLHLCITTIVKAQHPFLISGKVLDASSKQPLPYATVHLVGYEGSTLTKADGTFSIKAESWHDSLQITIVGYEPLSLQLQKGHLTGLVLEMKGAVSGLQSVTISITKKPGRSFMENVLDHKPANDPERFHSYNYRRYSRHELDLDNIDYAKLKKSGLKGLMASVYSEFDPDSRQDKELPVYFSETLAGDYHSVSPPIEKETILAKRSLGLKTDDLLQRLDKFNFYFNVYDNWIPVFNQTYVSPLNDKAFSYYSFFLGDTMIENGNRLRQVRFTPLRPYERTFAGTLWINDSSYAVESLDMHLTQTANLNFVKNIDYHEDYKEVYDSTTDKMAYMPSRYASEVKFEAGLSLLGIPVPENKESLQLVTRSNTILDKITINNGGAVSVITNLVDGNAPAGSDRSETYWARQRPDSLTNHEKNIYRMVDSLKENKRFQQEIKLIAFAGTGYWDFSDQLRVGPYSSFLSHNPIEGWRVRIGFWTMPGISNRFNFYGYGAYGFRDHRFKGRLGLKYVWNNKKWTKTSLWAGSDYDFILDQHDELDKDNLISSFLRKHIPFTRTYIKQVALSHEQYLSPDWSVNGVVAYKELNPVFDFKYHPINPALDKPNDSISLKKLPVAEASIGFRYAHKERTSILNYDQLRLGSFSPIFTVNYTHGFELNKTHFGYEKVAIGVEQQLRLPPKSLLYYKFNAGKVFGTIPYLLLNIPMGNEHYVSSRYAFNTMTPYEFAADRYISLHTRLSLGGALFDRIPFLQKLGWRETLSFNSYWGDMTRANVEYNRNSNFNLVGNTPFMEAAVGIDNIFHLLSIEYYRRFTQLDHPYAKAYGIYIGLHFTF